MITVEWANEEKTILRWYLKPGWMWEEFLTKQLEAQAMIDSVPGIVDGIVISESPRYIPPNALTNLREINQARHPRHGYSFVVGVQAFITTLLNALGRIIPNDNVIRFAKSEDEAYALIEEAQKKRAASDTPVN